MSSTDEQKRDLFSRVELGLDAQIFIEQTAVGKHLRERAKAQIEDAMYALLDVDAMDCKAVQDLQNKAALGTMFLQFINDAIMDGKNAETVLTTPEED